MALFLGINGKRLGLVVLIVAQVLCGAFFIADSIKDYAAIRQGLPASSHFVVELVATLTLASAIFLEILYLKLLVERNERIEQGMRIATGALKDLIDEYFVSWGLTPAEREVALFTIKGLSIADIAGVRNSRDGTIKAHLNGIYRKADVTGRTQLLSLLVEDLIAEALVDAGD
ncbi:MAG: helix-turn-helix transcriptional regulator [Paracoccaceae bacterium]